MWLVFCWVLQTNLVSAETLKTPAPAFKKGEIKLADQIIKIDIAENDKQRSHGLMFREKLGPNEGMLFIFEDEQILSFWMKNTLIDLSIGFFDKNRTLVDVKEMKAVVSVMETNLPSHQSKSLAKYALEMNKEWFTKNKIKLGSRFDFVKKPKSRTRDTK